MIPLLVKFPTRSRPERFRYALDLLVKHAHQPQDLHFLFTLDHDDPQIAEVERAIVETASSGAAIQCTVIHGKSASKIHAVNRDLSKFDLPWRTVIVASDDMHATANWDAYVIQAMEKYHPNGDGCLWFADGFQKDICTIPCMGRAYFDRFGYIYNPAYQSVFVDDEQTHVGFKLGRMTKINHVLFRHDHPAWNSNLKPDALYQRNEAPAVWAADERTYRARHAAGFP